MGDALKIDSNDKYVPKDSQPPKFKLVTERIRLLMIDNDTSRREALGQALEKSFVLISAKSISEALKVIEDLEVDGILLELNLPNIDGYELLTVFRNHPATLSTPVICMSDDDPVKVRERIEALGASALLRHPLDLSRLGEDLHGILYNLNQTVRSKDGKRVFTITFNDAEKYRSIRRCIRDHKNDPETLLLLSWVAGEKFITEEERPLIESGKLVFLEIKPSLIVKFPYLQDMSPVFQDIDSLLDEKAAKVHLIFDELRNLLNVYEGERALAKSYALAKIFEERFEKILLINTRAQKSDRNMFMQKISKIFLQDKLE